MAQLNGWELDESGNIIVAPLVRMSTMIAAQSAIGLRIEFPQPGDALLSPSGWAQVILTPHQAKELARELQNAADRILEIKPSGKPS